MYYLSLQRVGKHVRRKMYRRVPKSEKESGSPTHTPVQPGRVPSGAAEGRLHHWFRASHTLGSTSSAASVHSKRRCCQSHDHKMELLYPDRLQSPSRRG